MMRYVHLRACAIEMHVNSFNMSQAPLRKTNCTKNGEAQNLGPDWARARALDIHFIPIIFLSPLFGGKGLDAGC